MDNTRIQISQDGRSFVRGGKPFFYLGDTVWSASANARMDEWEEYLRYRSMQGFNVFQITALPQWDRSKPDLGFEPFAKINEYDYDYSRINDAYFDRFVRMLEMAERYHMTAAVVLLWCDQIEGTWAFPHTRRTKGMESEDIKRFVSMLTKRLLPLHPIYIISGDSKYQTEKEIQSYLLAMRTVKENDPDALVTLHPAGRSSNLPDALVQSPDLDFYMLQSGHQDIPCIACNLTHDFYVKEPVRPVVNGEPCYEALKDKSNFLTRYDAYRVRRAFWQSLLNGCAGVTYGGHGLWNWHDTDREFKKESGESLLWRDAMHLPGAWDYAFGKELALELNMMCMRPVGNLGIEGVACAQHEQALAAYLPYTCSAVLPRIGCSAVYGYNMSTRQRIELLTEETDAGTLVHMPPFNSDLLLIALGGRQPA